MRDFLTSRRRHQPWQSVRLRDAVHTAVFAPTGAGKGQGFILPFLESDGESAAVIDPKGESFTLTAGRRREAGHRVVRLDPFGGCGPGGDTLNPLDLIDRDSPTALDQCRGLAEALVVRTGQENDPHWNDAAEAWIAALIAFVVAYAPQADRSLQSVRMLLTNPEKMRAAIGILCGSELREGMLARLGHQLTHYRDKELASTLTSTNRHLRFLDTIPVARCTRTSSFDSADLVRSRMTVYLTLPPEHLRTQSPLLRLRLHALLLASVRGGIRDGRRVHYVLGEAASLGHMSCLDDAVDKYRAYGVRLQFYYQSLGQLRTCWPDGRDLTLLSNTTRIFTGANDKETAEFVSARLGERTQVVAGGGTSRGSSWQTAPQGGETRSGNAGSNDGWQLNGRKLLLPDEVVRLHPRAAICFHGHLPPIATWTLRAYERPSYDEPPRIGVRRAAGRCAGLVLSVLALVGMCTVGMIREAASSRGVPRYAPPARPPVEARRDGRGGAAPSPVPARTTSTHCRSRSG